MKKYLSVVLSGAVLASVFLSGCAGAPNVSETEETEIQTETTTPLSESHIDQDKCKQIESLYKEKRPYGTYGVYVIDDSINGAANYYVSEDTIKFSYGSLNGTYKLMLDIKPSNSTAVVTFGLCYGETVYSGCNSNDLNVGMIQTFIDDIIANNKDNMVIFEDSALAENADKIKEDMPVVYSRLITLAAKAFPELGIGIEDLGVDFGGKYRNVDPAKFISEEVEIKNEHKFVNGVCEDCGMTWMDYYHETIKKIGYKYDGGGYSANGQPSDPDNAPFEYVLMSSSNNGDAVISYERSNNLNLGKDEPVWQHETCAIVKHQDNKSSFIEFSFDGLTVEPRYTYYMRVESKDGDYSKIFESKESLMKNAELTLTVMDGDGTLREVWQDNDDATVRKMFEEEGINCKYYSKEEFVEMIWNDHLKIFDSMDKGMKWMDTTLSDAGIKWKKNQ